MAIKKTIELDVNTKAGLKAIDELGLSFEEAFTEADNLSGQIGELEDALYAMAASGDTSSQTYKDLSEQVGIYKKVIIDTDMSVDSLSQTTAQKMGGALSGVTAGFELGAGAMGAFGADSEKVEEALLRVQSAMAISQGVQGIRESIPAFKAMKTAIMGNVVVSKLLNWVMSQNPIAKILIVVGLLGVAIAALYAPIKSLLQMFGLVSDETESAAEANDRLNESHERSTKLLEKLTGAKRKQSEQHLALLQAEGASEKELHDLRMRMLEDEEDARKAALILSQNQLIEKSKALQKAIREDDEDLIESISEEIKEEKGKYEELNSLHGDFNHKKELEDIAYKKTQEQNRKDNIAKYKEHLAKLKEADNIHLSTLRELKKHELSLIDDEFEKERAIINNNFKIKREDLLANFKGTQEDKAALKLIYDEQEQIALDVLHKKRLVDIQRRAKEKAEAEAEAERNKPQASDGVALSPLVAEDEKQASLFAIRLGWNQKQHESDKEYAQRKAELIDAGFESAKKGLEAASSISDIILDSQLKRAGDNEVLKEKIRKESFKREKALNLSMALINGAQAVTSILAQYPKFDGGFAMIGALAASAIATTASVTKIASTSYSGGGSSGGGGGGGGGSFTAAPSFNIVGNSSENQLAASLGGQEDNVIKTYVVSEDVTTAQSLDRNRINTATL